MYWSGRMSSGPGPAPFFLEEEVEWTIFGEGSFLCI